MHLLDLKKDYHVHSNYNDHSPQELSIENVTRYAEKIELNTLAFTEHVRKTSDWIPRYLEEIDRIVSSGTKMVEVEPRFKWYSLSEIKFYLASYKNFQNYSIHIFVYDFNTY